MTKDDVKAAFLMLEMSEQGRPVEIASQYVASYIHSGGLDADEIRSFVGQIFARTSELLADPAEIWDGLLPGGPSPDHGYEVVDKAGSTARLIEFVESLNQDQVVEIAEALAALPNVGRLPSAAMHLLHEALDSGQLRDTIVGERISSFLAAGPDRERQFDVLGIELDTRTLKNENIVLPWPVSIYQYGPTPRSDSSLTVWFADRCEWFVDEMGEVWVKFIAKNGLDRGLLHMVAKQNVSHIVRTER